MPAANDNEQLKFTFDRDQPDGVIQRMIDRWEETG
jgi:hypothetical protein